MLLMASDLIKQTPGRIRGIDQRFCNDLNRQSVIEHTFKEFFNIRIVPANIFPFSLQILEENLLQTLGILDLPHRDHRKIITLWLVSGGDQQAVGACEQQFHPGIVNVIILSLNLLDWLPQ